MFKKKEFLVILIAAVLVTFLTFFLGRSDCPGCPDAFYYQGWPLTYFQTGGFAGINRRLPLNFLLDFLFWFAVLAAGWWVIRKLRKLRA